MKTTVSGTPPPPPGGGRRVFRWGILTIPLALGIGWWLLRSCVALDPWDRAMCGLEVKDRMGYTNLAALGLVLIAILAVAKVIWRRGSGHGPGAHP